MTSIQALIKSIEIEACNNIRDKRKRKLKYKVEDLLRTISLRKIFMQEIVPIGGLTFLQPQ